MKCFRIANALPLLFLLILAGCNGEPHAGKKIDKVILISIDALRADFLGCYNPAMKASPNIDSFAKQNIVFDSATSQGPSTAISHKSILYSLYPAIHKTTKETVPTETNRSPLEILQSKGFKTAAFVGGGQLGEKFGFSKGFDSYWEAPKSKKKNRDESKLQFIEHGARDWLSQNYKEKFFLFVHTYEVHCPYSPPKQYAEKFASWYQGPVDPSNKCGDNYYNKITLTEEDTRYIRDLYSGSVNFVDDFLGRLFSHLKDLGIYDETMIILLSDHGESLGERRYVGHNLLYEVQLRIPFILQMPGLDSKRIAEPVMGVDVMPTVFEVLGLGRAFPFQGRNLLPVIQGAGRIENERVLIAEQNAATRVRKGDWSCIFSLSGAVKDELYNVADDPEQVKNLAEQNPEKVKELKQFYAKMLSSSKDISAKFVLDASSRPELDEATKEQLEALGYVAE
ncbi:sulfatase-like hydrolase/transferase [bacterium]|nr:sulfatase-like hydrolase/transferase [bacterium]